MNKKRFFDPCRNPKQPESIKNVNNYLNGRVMDIQDAMGLLQDCGCGIVEDHPDYGYITLTRFNACHTVEPPLEEYVSPNEFYRVIRYSDA